MRKRGYAKILLSLGLLITTVGCDTEFDVLKIFQRDRGVTLILKDDDKKVTHVRLKRNENCYDLFYGANLSVCLQSCDRKHLLELAHEPNYRDVWKQVDHLRVHHRRERWMSLNGKLKIELDEGTWKPVKHKHFGPPQQCSTRFDGDACLASMVTLIDHKNPFQYYQKLLSKHVSIGSNLSFYMDAHLLISLKRIYALGQQALSLFQKVGRTSFASQSVFVSGNLKNAPALLCQLKSRAKGYRGANKTLRKALRENEKELRHSLYFLTRLSK